MGSHADTKNIQVLQNATLNAKFAPIAKSVN